MPYSTPQSPHPTHPQKAYFFIICTLAARSFDDGKYFFNVLGNDFFIEYVEIPIGLWTLLSNQTF
jgi:hypothetical protein